MAFVQSNRQARFSLEPGDEVLLLTTFEAVERLGESFTLKVGVISQSTEVDFLPRLGKGGLIEIYDEHDTLQRRFHGLLTDATLVGPRDAGFEYRLTLRPWFWFLTLNVNYRIFQDKTAVEIISQILQEAGLTDYDFGRVSRQATTREYCVQFRESDFDFISRLLQEEGIYYFFDHQQDRHVMILCDSLSAHEPVPGAAVLPFMPAAAGGLTSTLHVHEWDELNSASSKSVSLLDFNFKTPSAKLEGVATFSPDYDRDGAEVFDFPGRFDTTAPGEILARLRAESVRAERRIYRGVAQAPTLACGALVSLSQHEIARYNIQYLIVGQRFEVADQTYLTIGKVAQGDKVRVITVTFEATPADVPWRHKVATPWPVARGPQTAIVTGPAGEEVYVDEYGRVKVHFHWDRMQQPNEQSSCWIRVSQGWAGTNFGIVNLPRVGQEVVVDFLDGNPDRPIITGSVYNAARTVPYALPDNKTRSTWKSQSVGASGFNEIRYEDKAGAEEIYVHAQKDVNVDILNSRTTTIGQDETKTIQKGDETHTIEMGGRTTTIAQDDVLKVTQGGVTTTVDLGDMSLKTSLGSITLEAFQTITLKVGDSTITLDQAGVTIKGLMIQSEATLQLSAKAPMVQIEGQGIAMLKGGLVMIN